MVSMAEAEGGVVRVVMGLAMGWLLERLEGRCGDVELELFPQAAQARVTDGSCSSLEAD